MERRFIELENMELRIEESDGSRKLVGYPLVYNRQSVNLGGFREVVLPGAFDSSLAKDDIRALFNHDRNLILGRSSSGTLKLASNTKGLRMEISLPDTTLGRDLPELIQRGDVSGGSFSFSVLPDGVEWSEDDDSGVPLRSIRAGRLYDVGPVTHPAYPDTEGTMSVRHVGDAARELEEYLAAREQRSAEIAAGARERELRLAVG